MSPTTSSTASALRHQSTLEKPSTDCADTQIPYAAPPDWLDGRLVVAFFWKFSVFECALKRAGLFAGREGETVRPDWDRFGSEIRGRFATVCSGEFQRAVQRLKTAPPRRQVVRAGRITWEPVHRGDSDSEEELVLRLVRTARNNLFHGGKYPDSLIDEVARNTEILRAASLVLEVCFQLHPAVAQWVEDAA